MPSGGVINKPLDTLRFCRAYARRCSTLDYPPRTIFVETTSSCNLRCVTCPHGRGGLDRAAHAMSLTLFDRIVRQLDALGPGAVALHFGGEPLLHRALVQMVARTKATGAFVTLSTNGMLLSPAVSAELVAAGLDEIRVTFAPDPEIFEQQRRGASWGRVRDNLRALLAARRPGDLPRVVIDVLRLRDEYADAAHTARRIREILSPADAVEVITSTAHAFPGRHAEPGEDAARFSATPRGAAPRPCLHAWRQLAVLSDGVVVPCCRDLEARYPLGDARQAPLAALWNGERYRALRARLAEGRQGELALCRGCSAPWEALEPAILLRRRLLRGRRAWARAWGEPSGG